MAPRTNYRVTVTVDVKNEEHIEKLIKQLQRLQTTTKKDPMKPLRDSSKKTQIEMRKFGRGMQNASYQVQDFIVQVSGGVDPLRSFSQQAPQLLINMGALGAAIGVAAAAIPLLVDAFRDGETAALDMSDSLGVVSDAMSSLEKSMKNYLDEGTEFQRLLVDINQNIAEGKLVQYLKDVSEELEATPWEVWSSRAVAALNFSGEEAGQTYLGLLIEDIKGLWTSAADSVEADAIRLKKVADAFNINPQAAASAQVVLDTFESSAQEIGDFEVALKSLEDVLAQAFAAGDESAEGLLRTIEAMRKEMAALAGNNVLQEITPQGSAVTPSTPGGGGGGRAQSNYRPDPDVLLFMKQVEEQQRAEAEALREQQAAYSALYPEMARFAQQVQTIQTLQAAGALTQEEYNRHMKEAQEQLDGEQFSLMAEAAEIFNKSFDTMLDGILMGTRDIEDAFKDMAKVVIAQLLKLSAYKAIASMFGGTAVGDAASGLLTNAKGNAFSGGNVVPFAKGGVVSSPTLFPMAKGAGLMGEKGPEVIAPLYRASNGDMGIKTPGMNVTVNNMAAGVQVQPRQTDNGLTIDVVMDSMAQAIERGGNRVSNAMEQTFALGRGRGVY